MKRQTVLRIMAAIHLLGWERIQCPRGSGEDLAEQVIANRPRPKIICILEKYLQVWTEKQSRKPSCIEWSVEICEHRMKGARANMDN